MKWTDPATLERAARHQRILELRAAGLSQSAIAELVGCTQPNVSYVLAAAAGRPRNRKRKDA